MIWLHIPCIPWSDTPALPASPHMSCGQPAKNFGRPPLASLFLVLELARLDPKLQVRCYRCQTGRKITLLDLLVSFILMCPRMQALQAFSFAFVELHEVYVSLFLQPVLAPLSSSPVLQHADCSPPNFMSSTNLLKMFTILRPLSLMKMLNSINLISDPWGMQFADCWLQG